eukprot:gene14187-biopygen10864
MEARGEFLRIGARRGAPRRRYVSERRIGARAARRFAAPVRRRRPAELRMAISTPPLLSGILLVPSGPAAVRRGAGSVGIQWNRCPEQHSSEAALGTLGGDGTPPLSSLNEDPRVVWPQFRSYSGGGGYPRRQRSNQNGGHRPARRGAHLRTPGQIPRATACIDTSAADERQDPESPRKRKGGGQDLQSLRKRKGGGQDLQSPREREWGGRPGAPPPTPWAAPDAGEPGRDYRPLAKIVGGGK